MYDLPRAFRHTDWQNRTARSFSATALPNRRGIVNRGGRYHKQFLNQLHRSRASVTRETIGLAGTAFRNASYQRHNHRRLEHLASLGLDLVSKSVLEVGAGVGDHVFFFLDRNCAVVSLEARDENCQLFTETIQAAETSGYGKASHVKLVQGDAESLNAAISENFDIVYCYGLLYHLEDPEAALRAMACCCWKAVYHSATMTLSTRPASA